MVIGWRTSPDGLGGGIGMMATKKPKTKNKRVAHSSNAVKLAELVSKVVVATILEAELQGLVLVYQKINK